MSQSAPRQGSYSLIGAALRAAEADMRQWWEPAESFGAEMKRTLQAGHTAQSRTAQEDAPRR